MKSKKYPEVRCPMEAAPGMEIPDVLPGRGEDKTLPYYSAGRDLVIPMGCPPWAKWWDGGLLLEQIRAIAEGRASRVPVKEIEWG